MQKKKVALYVPVIDPKTTKKTGFLTKAEVSNLENKLSGNSKISFFGNVDFNKVKIIGTDFYCADINLRQLDLFFWYAPGMKKFIEELKALAKIVKVIKDPFSFDIVDDKFKAHLALKTSGLPIPDFALVQWDDLETMRKIMKEWKVAIVKPRCGSYGRGIVKVETFETLRDIAGMLMFEHKQRKIFVEKFYQNDKNAWISATVIKGKAIYGYRKKEEKFADWKVYDLNAEGKGAYYVDPKPIKALAEKASAILDTSIVGFDFIKTEEGYKLVDENNFPGFYPEAFAAASENVSDLIVDLIISASA